MTWQLYIPTFKGIQTSIKLSDIKVCNPDGVEFDDIRTDKGGSGRCRGFEVKVYKMNLTTGLLTDSMGYDSTGGAKWGENGGVAISEGEGLIVRNGFEDTSSVKFQIAGEVILAPSTRIDTMTWGVIGNNTPVDRKLKDFIVCNPDGVEFDDIRTDKGGSGRCRGFEVKVYKMNATTGLLGNSMGYDSTGGVKWGDYADVDVAAGEALVVRNGFEDTACVIIKVKGPLAE